MKNISHIFTILAFSALSFSACGFSDDTNDGNPTNSDTAATTSGSAKLGGESCETGAECKSTRCQDRVCTCSASVGCTESRYCDSNNTCQYLKAAGAKCTKDAECTSGTCVDNTVCSCTTNEECTSNVSASATCSNNICRSNKGVNESCSTKFECSSNVCTSNKCGCSENSECSDDEYCKDSLCTAKELAGKKCSTGSDCRSGTCSKEGMCTGCSKSSDCADDRSQLCDQGACRAIVVCPGDNSKKCFQSQALTPNIRWYSGEMTDNSLVDGDYLGSTFDFILPSNENVRVCVKTIESYVYFYKNYILKDGMYHKLIDPKTYSDAKDTIEFLALKKEFLDAVNRIKSSMTDVDPNTGEKVYYLSSIVNEYLSFKQEDLSTILKEVGYTPSTPGGSDSENPVPNLIDMLPIIVEKIGDKDLFATFVEKLNIYIYNIVEDRYLKARLSEGCIQASIGENIPLTLEYKDNPQWKGHNFYLTVTFKPSELMASTDKYILTLSPGYKDYTTDNVEILKNRLEFPSQNNDLRSLSAYYEYNAERDDDKKGTFAVNVRFDYHPTAKEDLTCSDYFVRTQMCPAGSSIDSDYSDLNACGETKVKTYDDKDKPDCSESESASTGSCTESCDCYQNCKASVAVDLANIKTYIELTDSDF